MRGIYTVAGLVVLSACAAGWAALDPTQPERDQKPAMPEVPVGAVSPPLVPDPAVRPVTLGFEVPVPGKGAPVEVTVPPAPMKLAPVPAGMLPLPQERPAEPDGAEVSAGRQEPAVSLEWRGEATARVGQPAVYTLVVRNAGTVPVQQVIVRVRVPAGLGVLAAEPRAPVENNLLVWELGTLLARQEQALLLKVVPEAKGDVAPQAWVTFTGSALYRIKVREPRLVVKASAPERVLVGDPASVTLTVSNPGDGPADQVKVHANLSEGLEHARGSQVDVDVGSLAAGESRQVTLLCAARSGGLQRCEATAEADGGLTGRDAARVRVITPQLDLHLSGPALRYLGRKAIYTLTATNSGDSPVSNVTLADVVPDGFKVLAASDGGRYDFQARTVSWFLGEVGPGQSRAVKLEVQAAAPGEQHHQASASGARGLHAEAGLTTRVEGLSALLLEVSDTEDPVEVNGDTAYEVRLTNTGSKPEADIKLVATVPDRMEFRGAQGPAHYRVEGRTVVFEPLARLDPRADAVFRLNVRALEPGTVCFKVQVTSANLTEPVIKMEPTRVYADN
jgi:uncharacterized repeat protein (TIGR01451 family)